MPSLEASAAADLAPRGVLRAAINLGNVLLAARDPAGELTGVTVDLARELGRRLGVPVALVPYPAGGAVIPGLAQDAWDIAFLAVEPERAEQAAFTAPYLFIDGTYLVRDAAAFKTVADLDAQGVRIAVGRGAAYDLALTRLLQRATLVRAATSAEAIALFKSEGLEAAAGIRQALADATAPGLRVLPDSFSRIEQGMALPPGRPLATRYLEGFVEEMKASGFVRRALDRHGQTGAVVAPPRSA